MSTLFLHLSIRVKLAVLAGAVVVLVVLGQALQALSSEAIDVQENVALQARLVLTSVAGAVATVWQKDAPPDLAPFAERVGQVLDLRVLALLGHDGELLAHAGEAPTPDEVRRVTRLRLRAPARSLWSLATEPLELTVATPVLRGAEVRGYILCAFRAREPGERLQRLALGTLWTTLLWVAIGVGATLWVARRLTAPLVRLADDLVTLGDREGYHVPASGLADGEIGLVQSRLEQLGRRLAAERGRADELHTALQHQVNVVSADLERALRQRQVILDSVRDGLVLIDAAGRATAANQPALALFGSALDTAPIWRHVSEPAVLASAVGQALALGAPVMVRAEVGSARLRVRVARAAGSDAAVLTAEDVSESQRLEEQMQRSERLSALGTLSAGLAHQIGNHLSAIKGYADLLARRATDERLLADLGAIRKEVHTASALMDRVLLLARTRPTPRAPFALATLVREALDLVRTQARHGGVEIVDALSDACVIHGDPNLLLQAVLNLLINAIQAMAGGGRLTVASAQPAPGACAVTIADSGPGIPEELRKRVFDPFFTTKPEGEGTGLGLAIAQRIVELHGGSIRLDSEVGHGACFELRFPLAKQAEEGAGA